MIPSLNVRLPTYVRTVIVVLLLVTGSILLQRSVTGSVCNLPLKKGVACSTASSQRWWFDSSNGLCISFKYLGCQGNANAFSSMEQCQTACASVESKLILHSVVFLCRRTEMRTRISPEDIGRPVLEVWSGCRTRNVPSRSRVLF